MLTWSMLCFPLLGAVAGVLAGLLGIGGGLVLVTALVWLLPLRLGPVLEPVAVLGFTVTGCWLLTDGAVRRLRWMRPLFGLGPAPRAARATQTPRPPRPRPARPGTRAGAPPPSTRR